MLNIKRKDYESVALILPDGRIAWVIVHNIGSRNCKLAFDAPKDLKIVRGELMDIPQPQLNQPQHEQE